MDELRVSRTVARGRLSLDHAKAREKMRKFRLPDPYAYVLQFMRAASILGASEVRFTVLPRMTTCEFPGRLPANRLIEPWSVGYDERSGAPDAAMYNVALGIGAAQALELDEITLTSGSHQIVFQPDDEIITAQPDDERTVITVKKAFRFGLVKYVYMEPPETRILREYCSYATIDVYINDVRLEHRDSALRHLTRFESQNERGYAALRGPSESSEVLVLRDDVVVSRQLVRSDLTPFVGVLNSRTLQTDLSGLALAPDTTLDPLIREHVMNAYHGSVLACLDAEAEIEPIEPIEPIEVGLSVSDFFTTLRDANEEPGAHTLALRDWFIGQPVFEAADRTDAPWISLADARHAGRIAYSRVAFPDEKVDAYPAVLLARTEVARDLMRKLDLAGISTHDVTSEFEAAQFARHNREVWQARPRLLPPARLLQKSVEVADARGYVFVPTESVTELDVPRFELSVRIDGRQIRRLPLPVPLGVVFDGAFEPNETHTDVVHSAAYVELAVLVAAQIPDLLADLGAALDRLPGDVAWVYHRSVELAVAGRLELELFCALGLERELAARLTQPGARSEATRREVLEWLSPIVDLPTILAGDGTLRSMNEIAAAPVAPILVDEHHSSNLFDALLERVLVVDHSAANIVRWLRPDAKEARDIVVSLASEAVFMRRPLFQPTELLALVAKSTVVDLAFGRAQLRIDLFGIGDSADVYIVYRGRLLAHRGWFSDVGRLRIIVKSDMFTPSSDFLDVAEDEVLHALQRHAEVLARDLAQSWASSVRDGQDLDSEAFSYLWTIALRQALADPRAVVLPVFVREGEQWVHDVRSAEQVLAHAGSDGAVLHATRSPFGPPEALAVKGLVLRLPARRFSIRKLLPQIRIVELDDLADHGDERDRYFERPLSPRHVGAALHTWRGTLSGVDVETGMFEELTRRAINRVDVVWEGRLLEQTFAEVAAGMFQTIVSGDAISPDPTYSFVASPRGDVLRAAAAGCAEVVRDACRLVTARSTTAFHDLLALRLQLMRLLAWCHDVGAHPEFDVHDVLHDTPLFDTTYGPRLRYGELAELAQGDERAIPYTHWNVDEHRALLVARDDLKTVAAAAGDHVLASVVTQTPTAPTAAVLPRFHEDELLNELAVALVEARTDDRAHFYDELAFALRWAPAGTADLCTVDRSGIWLSPSHAIVAQCRAATTDPIPRQFLVSLVHAAVSRERVTPHLTELRFHLLLLSRLSGSSGSTSARQA